MASGEIQSRKEAGGGRMRGGRLALATLAALIVSTAGLAQDVDPTGGLTGTQYLQLAKRQPGDAKQIVLTTSKDLIADHRVSHKFVCLPDGVTYVRGPALLDDYLAGHREQLNYSLHQLVFIAWMTAFPC